MNDRKVALITGSGTGVGAATALMLARRGYNLLINYSRSEAEALASQAACDEAGADTLLMQGDVAEDADCRALVGARAGALGARSMRWSTTRASPPSPARRTGRCWTRKRSNASLQ
jgi:NAD(P)-dependent dehydrogenase (short-subunit alcohol dehydrogenase family)